MEKTIFAFRHTSSEPVPVEVIRALTEAIAKYANEHYDDYQKMHDYLTDEMRTAFESRDGWEGFCMCYRHENTPLHALCYSLFSSVGANTPKATK